MNIDQNHRLGSRNQQRWRLNAMIEMRDGHRHQKALVADVSVSGLRLQTLNPLRLGQSFWVKLGNIEAREITVLWVDGLNAGCSFTNPLAEYVLEQVLMTAEVTVSVVGDRRASARL